MLSASPAPPRKGLKKNACNSSGQNIKVFVRLRPINDIERSSKSNICVECPSSREIIVHERPLDKYTKKFVFDKVFDQKSKQIDIYKSVAKPLVEEVLNGFNCTLFAYGQTGTGKTYTMEGELCSEGISIHENTAAGVIPRCVNQLFDEVSIQKLDCIMKVSFLELYNEELFDLLSAHDDLTKLKMYEEASQRGSCKIKDLQEVYVRSKMDVYKIIEKGSAKRQTAATLMNATSSRSHTVFTVTVHVKESTPEGDELLKIGKLHLVDLAGSENIGRSGAVEKRAREAGNINQSLLTLGRVITSLVEKAPHVPYRESKLTRILQDALGGRTKTSIIATISPASVNLEESLSTLDYAHRAKNIQNRPEVNQKIKEKYHYDDITSENERLRRDLIATQEKQGIYMDAENYKEFVTAKESLAQEITEKTAHIRSLESEVDKQTELYTEAQEELKQACEELGTVKGKLVDTKDVLHCTQKLLSNTEDEREEQKYLVSVHAKTENDLHTQGRNLINVAHMTTSDIGKLHDKLDRKRKVEVMNEESEKTFGREFEETISAMRSSFYAFKEHHSTHSSAIIEELGDFMKTKRSDLDRVSDELQTMGASMLEALNKCDSLHASKVEDVKERSCEFSSALTEKASEEEKMLDTFISGVFQPLVNKMTASLATLHGSLCELRDSNLSKICEMKDHCVSVCEKETSLLNALEGRISSFIEFPSKFAQQMADKSQDIEDKIRSHSKNLKELSKYFTELAVSQEELLASQFPLLDASQQHNLNEIERTAKKGLSEVQELKSLSLEHKTNTDKLQKETQTCLRNGVFKIESETTELEKDLSELSQRVQGQASASGSVFRSLQTTANDNKDAIVECVKESKEQFYNNVTSMRETLSSELKAETNEIVILKEEMETLAAYQDKLTGYESELEEFLSDQTDQLAECGERVQNLLTKQLKKDLPTGSTPSRQEYVYPKSLAETSPHERLLNRYRIKHNCASKIPLPMLSQDGEEELSDSSLTAVSCNSSADAETGFSRGPTEQGFAVPVSKSASFKDGQTLFAHPVNTVRQESREDLSKQNVQLCQKQNSLSRQNSQNSLSRSSSTSSLTDSKENQPTIITRRGVASKKRELKPPSTTTINMDKLTIEAQSTRSRKVLGHFN